jgi:hypothetical protein
MDWPLGERESLKSEFKRVEALKDPANIAREVVAFLNAEGGEIWIGVGEAAGVADLIEEVPNPELQRDRLQDALVDLVEPSPIVDREMGIEVVPFPADPTRGLLRVRVEAGRRGPYALLRQTTRAYLKRTGSRLRPMTREELAQAFRQASTDEDRVAKVVREIGSHLRKRADEGFAGLRVLVRAVGNVELELEKEKLEPLFRDPRPTGNRPLGWNFTSSHYYEVRPFRQDDQSGYRLGDTDSVQWTTISTRGDIEFSSVLERLQGQGQAKSLWPLALLEFPVSVARLARTLYAMHASRPLPRDTPIVLGLGLFQIKEWRLAPGSPHSMAYLVEKPRAYTESDSFLGEPLVVPWAEFDAWPDRCAYRLVRQVYQAFGYEERDIPQEFNRDTGQLTFPR